MHAAVFAYDVDAAGVERFEAMYGPDGEWARFFRSGAGYLGSELWRGEGGRYLLIDRWESPEAYDSFLVANAEEYRRRSEAGEVLYRRETSLGRYESG
jgi:heme-degrading monooxygenase HmoA